jgi:DNA helicase-2/ATP-dependent DNA helicase PcrA
MLAMRHRRLCVVGDPDQSIYSWRGANIRNILEFEHDFKDAKVITLEQNYRSTLVILDASNKLIQKNKNRREKSLFTELKSGDPVCIRELATEGEEARWAANQIHNLIESDGISLDDVAVFYRTNAQSRSFEDTFRRYQIPYRLIGAVRFYDRREIKDILSYAKLLVNPNDTVSLLRVINTPRRGIGPSAQDVLIAHGDEHGVSLYKALKSNAFVEGLKPTAKRGAKEFVDLIEGLTLEAQISSPGELMKKLLELSGYEQSVRNEVEKDPEAQSRLENLSSLVTAVKEYEERCLKEDAEPTLSGYLQEVSLITSAEEVEGADTGAVTLMTVHLAKGLEFPVVFVTGLEEGLFPLSGRDEDDLEEERRLCYVAMTRAKKILHMCYSSTRRIFGKTYANLPSRFLFDCGLMETAQYEEGAQRREITGPRFGGHSGASGGHGYGGGFKNAPKHGHQGRYNQWSSFNSMPYDNSSNYEDGDFSAPAPAFAKPAQTQEPDASETGGVKVGSRVKHGVFGQGKVTLISGSGDSTKITVVFSNATKRVFLLKYAPLEIL